jgi:carbonic anhydrase/acetyltransferase-like protein (isoleucine patch superfamily)
VSDTSQDQGWWVASDGEWYPPETHPDRRAASSALTHQAVPDADESWWQAPDGESYPAVGHPNGTAASSGLNSQAVPDADERWWRTNDDESYPSGTHPNGTAASSGLNSQAVPDADERWWQVPDGESYPSGADDPTATPEVDLDPSSEGAWSLKPRVAETHDFYDGCGPVPAHRHVNGGGWVANTATVSRTAFVGPASAVFESSRVLGRATVADQAQVRGQSEVSGNAHVSGNAVIDSEARVTDEAEVSGHAFVGGRAAVSHSAQVGGYTQLVDGEVTERDPQATAQPEPLAAEEPEPLATAQPEPLAAEEPEPVAAEEPEPQLVSGDNAHSVSSTLDLYSLSAVPTAASPQSLLHCPGCGTECTPEASFCAACGHPLAIREVPPTRGSLVPITGTAAPPLVSIRKRRFNALSVWSIVLVIVLGSIGALVAIPMGFVARRQIRSSQGRQKGAGLALAAVIIGFVFIAITLAIVGLVLTSSGSSGPSLSGLTSSVRAQIAGNGPDSLKVPGVASVVCNPPSTWQTGASFTCFAYSSTGSTLGKYEGTVAPNSSSGQYEWNATWYSSG